jgi:small subunit ribosomal protein S16
MLVIRLARGGRTKYPVYRIVAAESSRAATGKFVEVLGHYNPHTKDLSIKKEETELRLSHGAQPSNSVIKLLQKENIELPTWVKLKEKSRKPKNAPEEPEAPAQEAAAESNDAAADASADESANEDELRVAEAATENEAAVSDNAPDDSAETAEIVEKQAEKAEQASDAGAKAAGAEPAEDADAK